MDGGNLVLYRQSIEGEWKVLRHSGFHTGRWRVALCTRDEGKADAKYREIFEGLRQGGVRMVDPQGVVIQNFYTGAPTMRWGERYQKPKKIKAAK